MALHKLTAGDGYTYLTRDIARPDPLQPDPLQPDPLQPDPLQPDPLQPGPEQLNPGQPNPSRDAADYYTAQGNPPGRWLGRGLGELDLSVGDPVSTEQMRALFGEGMHPDAAAIIDAYQREHITADTSPDQLGEVVAAAAQAARLGRPFPTYALLDPFEDRVAERLAQLAADAGRDPTAAEVARAQGIESRRQRHAVAGYDLVFTPPKTVSLLWALHPDPAVRLAVKDAHDAAIGSAMALLEEHAAFTRTGKAGVAQIETHGLVAVAFDHWDARSGDPNLHTHVAVSNKVRGVDGVWRALDARPLHAITVAASERYNAAVTHHLVEALGVEVEARQTTRRDTGSSPGSLDRVGGGGPGKEPVWEVAGIRPEWAAGFSRRSAAIGPRYEHLVDAYRAEHGRDPSARVAHQLARQANLETRQAKTPPTSLAAKRDDWTAQFVDRHGEEALTELARTTRPPRPGRRLGGAGAGAVGPAREVKRDVSIDRLAASVVARVGEQRSTWTVANIRAETERILHDPAVAAAALTNQADNNTTHQSANQSARLTSSPTAGPRIGDPDQSFQERVENLVEQVAARAAGSGFSISLAVPTVAVEPDRLRRSDGASVFVPHGSTRYTSRAVLDAEQHLLTAAGSLNPHAPTYTATAVNAALDGFETTLPAGRRLDAWQRALVVAFATDPRRLVAGLGAAGTGKTTAMRAYLRVLTHTPPASNHPEQPGSEQSGRGQPAASRRPRLVPLASSAVSAAVLGEDLGLPHHLPAENLHKFLYEHLAGVRAADLSAGVPPDQLPAWARKFVLQPGDVILIDEAGMAGTHNLSRLVTIAENHGASVRLLGDPRQLPAVESGGALRLIADEAGAVELSVLHRFSDPDEATATLQLRTGDPAALEHYAGRGRIVGGSSSAMREAAYTAWATDMSAGLTTFMPAAANADVVALSTRARTDRVTAGQVEPAGVALHDGNLAGVGDWIVTRRNNRRITTTTTTSRTRGGRGGQWVRNADGWHVVARHDDGALDVVHLRHGGQVRLPADYVAEHVELLYATTVHRVQGGTVDTAHPLITDAMTREHLYVAATRARDRTTFYVATHDVLPLDEDQRMDASRRDPDNVAARQVLHQILTRESAQLSATQSIRDTQNEATSLARLIPRYLHADSRAHATRLEQVLDDVLGARVTTELVTDPDWPDLARALRRAEHAGWKAETALTRAVQRTPSPLEGIASRITATRIDGVDAVGSADPAGAAATSQAAHRKTSDASAGRSAAIRMAAAIDAVTTDPSPEATTSSQHQYASQLGHATGSRLAGRIVRESAWPALQAALRDAEHHGHDPAQLLRVHANRRDLHATPSAAHALARRIHEHLQSAQHQAQQQALHRDGRRDRHTASPLGPDQPPGATDSAVTTTGRPGPGGEGDLSWLPPWLPPPGNDRYLRQLAEAIQARVEELARTSSHDDWTTTLGAYPQHPGAAPDTDPGARQNWDRAVGFVAAYREQHHVDDPAHPLGPYLPAGEPGPDRTGAQRRDQHHAAIALVRAQQLGHQPGPAGPDSAAYNNQVGQAHRNDYFDSIERRIALDTYRALPGPERAAVATAVTVRLDTSAQLDAASLREATITDGTNANQLRAALVERGHIEPVQHDPLTAHSTPQGPEHPAQRTARLGARSTPQGRSRALRSPRTGDPGIPEAAPRTRATGDPTPAEVASAPHDGPRQTGAAPQPLPLRRPDDPHTRPSPQLRL